MTTSATPAIAARLFIIAGQHGDEPEGLMCAADLMRAGRVALGTQRLVRLHGMINPEGFARTRRHRDDDRDPNRVWGTTHQTPLQAQILGEIQEAAADGPVLVLDCHSSHSEAHLLYAGPVGAAAARDADVSAHGERRAGSLAAWCEDRGIPAIVVEARRGGVPSDASAMARAVVEAWAERACAH